MSAKWLFTFKHFKFPLLPLLTHSAVAMFQRMKPPGFVMRISSGKLKGDIRPCSNLYLQQGESYLICAVSLKPFNTESSQLCCIKD